MNQLLQPYPGQARLAHLEPGTWARANRLLLKKALAEFAHELLLEPINDDHAATHYQAKPSTPDVSALDHR